VKAFVSIILDQKFNYKKLEANPNPNGQGLTSNVITFTFYYILCIMSNPCT